MSPRLPSLCALSLALAGGGALADRARAAPCPNYPFVAAASFCTGSSFCGEIEPEATATPEIADPGPLLFDSPDPLAFEHGATAGSGDLYAIVETSVGVGRSSLDVVADVDFVAPINFSILSGAGDVSTRVVLRATDLVFSGPGSEVETSLRFALDGSFDLSVEEGKGDSTQATVYTLLGGGICGEGVSLEFEGYAQVSDTAVAGMAPLRNVTDSDLLEGVDLNAVTEFTRGPFTVPTGVPLQLELWMESGAGGATSGGDGSSRLELIAKLGPQAGGDVFDLPAGYSVDSAQAGIADNRVVPERGAPAALALFVLGSLARRRGAGDRRRLRA